MSICELKTPILFLVFNRPETTRRVFNEIKKVRPTKLFVSADGPREKKPKEIEKCREVREIINQVDWPCEVVTNFRENNLGCKIAVSSGITWFFENVEEGIILEDDTMPHPSFFRFCEELLEKYRNDERIMMISGNNFQFGRKRTNYSYYFSSFTHIWGWASWRRAWKHYDVKMGLWPELRDGGWMNDIFLEKKAVKYWTDIFEKVYQGKIDTWDYQWSFACLCQRSVNVLPNLNLVSNIGFGQNSTHTTGNNKFSNIDTESIHFPLKHPPFILQDSCADIFTQKDHYNTNSLGKRAINKLIRVFK